MGSRDTTDRPVAFWTIEAIDTKAHTPASKMKPHSRPTTAVPASAVDPTALPAR